MLFIFKTKDEAARDAFIEQMNKEMRDYTQQAARGEIGWICSDCGVGFPKGMPDKCEWGHQSCTDIIVRDKARASKNEHD